MSDRYIRAAHCDTRMKYGDSFASDAWLDTATNQIVNVPVLHDPNRVPVTTRHEVMNPPASAARGAEARNLNSANIMGLGEVHRASKAKPADDVPAPSVIKTEPLR